MLTHPASAEKTRSPASPTSPTRGPEALALERRLTPRQRLLVQAVVAGGGPPAPTPFSDTLVRFITAWTREPIECIRAVNAGLARVIVPPNLTEYLKAAVDLEILMDRWLPRAGDGQTHRGIPSYLADGYTDLGADAAATGRRGREKIRIDKERLRPRLMEYRRRALASGEPDLELLRDFYETVQREIAVDTSSVNHITRDAGDVSILLSRYMDEGIGVCRHLCLAYQLALQEAGLPSRVVKGTLRLFGIKGKHAWNLVWLKGRVALVDVTLPGREGPLLLVGNSQEEVYGLAGKSDRSYLPAPDQDNYHRYGRVDGSS